MRRWPIPSLPILALCFLTVIGLAPRCAAIRC